MSVVQYLISGCVCVCVSLCVKGRGGARREVGSFPSVRIVMEDMHRLSNDCAANVPHTTKKPMTRPVNFDLRFTPSAGERDFYDECLSVLFTPLAETYYVAQ